MPVVVTSPLTMAVPLTDRFFTAVTWPVSQVSPVIVRSFEPPFTAASVIVLPVSVVSAPSVTASL